jgi:hypothetical protein
LAGKVFYATAAAGAIFIAIGIASSIYAGVAVDVPLDNVVGPGKVDIISPDMNEGSKANLILSGSSYEVAIMDPDGQNLALERGNATFNYDLTAQRAGEYRMIVNNTGSADLVVSGHAETKSSPLGFTGALMLVITGVIVIGLGLRFRRV